MSIYALIRVKEVHGIRRTLYPLSTIIDLKNGDPNEVVLIDIASKQTSPVQLTKLKDTSYRLDFYVSIAPNTTLEFELADGNARKYPDPLQITHGALGGLRSRQDRFYAAVEGTGIISDVEYDGFRFLRFPMQVLRNGRAAQLRGPEPLQSVGQSHISAWVDSAGSYPDRIGASNHTEVSACKSWIKIDHHVDRVHGDDRLEFRLPYYATSPTLLCGFGVGGYTYTKFDRAQAQRVGLHIAKTTSGNYSWQLHYGDRLDATGFIDDLTALKNEVWFNITDSDKSIITALTQFPDELNGFSIDIESGGDINITFEGGASSGSTYSVCYYFLNDNPVMAASTSPQAIINPLVVEIEPVG